MKKKKNKNKKKDIPFLLVDDSQYADLPVTKTPDNIITEEEQAQIDEIQKNMTFKHMHNRMCFLFTPNTMYNELKWYGKSGKMLSLILIKLNEEKAIYEFHPNASAEYGIIELDRKSNVAIVKEPLQGSEWYTVHALNKLEEYGASNLFPNKDIIYWY